MFTGPNIVTDGLVLALDAANVKSYPGSGTTWYDKSGNGNNGTLTNGPTSDSGNNGSIVFDGVDDYISFANLTNTEFFNSLYPEGITIMTWILLPSNFSIPNGDGRSIFYRGNGGASGNHWHFSLNNSSGNVKLRWWIGTSNSYSPWLHYAQSSLQVGVHYHCVLTWKPVNSTQANTNMYLNGQIDYTNTATKSSGISLTSASILGNFPGSNWGPYYNQYSLAVYNKALTAEEILQNYNATKSRFNL